MSFFNFFNKNRKNDSRNPKVRIEEQLSILDGLGIKPNFDGFVDWICYEWGREEVESDPYNLLLYSLGGEREVDGEWLTSSDSIYCFDTECVEDDDTYTRIIKSFARITKGIFEISNISSYANHDQHTVGVSFTYDGKNYDFPLKYQDDWFDFQVVREINALLTSNDSDQYFYTSFSDQNLFVIFGTETIINEINKLVSVPFEFN